jgi:hypothetical protein
MLNLGILLLAIPKFSEPRLRFAYGGTADFLGQNNTIFNILSYPNISVSMKTVFTDSLMPRPSIVHGSFFTEAFVKLRSNNSNIVNIEILPDEKGFRVCDENGNTVSKSYIGEWKDFQKDNLRVLSKVNSVLVRANGWDMNFTKTKVEFPLPNTLTSRLNLFLKTITDSHHQHVYGVANTERYSPHGLLGQSFDANKLAVNGPETNYNAVQVYMKEQAEGVIEGIYKDYIVPNKFSTDYKFSRFDLDKFYPERDISKLSNNILKHKSDIIAEINDELGVEDYRRKVQ